jgi:hypothetical protein
VEVVAAERIAARQRRAEEGGEWGRMGMDTTFDFEQEEKRKRKSTVDVALDYSAA